MADRSASSPALGVAAVEVPWTRVEGFVGKLAHDIRNGFNAVELQVTLVGELSDDPEIKEEVKRIRQTLAGLTRQLQAVRLATGEPTTHLFPYPAVDLLEDLRERFGRQFPDATARVQWATEVGAATVNVDPEQTLNAALELLDNAVQHAVEDSTVRVEARLEAGDVAVTIHQQLTDAPVHPPADWGRTPLLSTRRNVYGLGAFRARRIFEAQGGALDYTYTEVDRALVTTVTLPTAIPPPRP